jgi:hypothetical protein
MEFQYNSQNGIRFTVKKVFCPSCKVPFIVDQLLPNLGVLWSMGLSDRYGVSGKALDCRKRYK